jgi:uncharacterized phosphosugar-binding protein
MATLSRGKDLFHAVHATLDEVLETEAEQIAAAAAATADRLAGDGMLHVFGTGHSHLLAEEVFFRAGGLAQVNAILDPGLMLHLSASGSTQLERLDGYSRIVLDRYDLHADDVLLVISNSGRNAGPIDAALYARERGLLVIAVTSAANYRNKSVRHRGDQHLSEVADFVIDTHVPVGDAAVSLTGLSERVGALSTAVGATIMQAFVTEIVSILLERGHQPAVIVSANVDDGPDASTALSHYAHRIRHR